MSADPPGLPPAPEDAPRPAGYDRHTCLHRLSAAGPFQFTVRHNADRWIRAPWKPEETNSPKLPRICSHCQSLHPNDALSLIVQYDWQTFINSKSNLNHVYFVPPGVPYDHRKPHDAMAVLHTWHLTDEQRTLLSDALTDQKIRHGQANGPESPKE